MEKEIYTIAVLDDKDYDSLHKQFPYITEEKLKDSLGFADKEKREAYVRRTVVKEMDAATMQHELQELLAKNSGHEDENGIRWKGGVGGIFEKIAPVVVPVLGTLLGGVGGATLGPILGSTAQVGSTVGGALGGAGASAAQQAASGQRVEPLPTILSGVGGALGGAGMAPGIQAAKTVPTTSGFLGQLQSGVQSALGMTTKAATEAAKIGLPSAIGQGLAPSAAQTYASGIGVLAQPALAKSISTRQPLAMGNTNVSPMQTNVKAGVGGGIEKTGEKNLFQKLTSPENILGTGLVGASMLPKTPTFQMPSSIEDIRRKLLSGQGLTPLGQQAQAELQTILKTPASELYPTANDEYYNAALRRTRENYTEAQKQLDAAYNLAGVYGTGEHLAAKAKLQEELARTESALASETEQRRFELARTEKYNAIQQALGVDAATMDDLVGLTGLDVQTAAMIYGANVQDVQQIRQALGTLGTELLIRGTQKPGVFTGTGGININLGR